MSERSKAELTRRQVLRTAGQGALLAGLATPLSSLAADDTPKDKSKEPAPSAGSNIDWNGPLAPPDEQPPTLKIPQKPGKQLGFAILGLGELALAEVLPATKLCEKMKPVALISGHPDKARAVAAAYRIPEKNIYGYDNLAAIRDNPEIDVVYVITPNSLHAEHSIRSLQAGKHVLCEKPMAASSKECQEMIDAAKQVEKKLMIAYRLRYEPYNQSMIEMARNGAFGQVRLIEASNVQDVKAPNIRLSRALAGGALMDVGIYCLNAARYITGEEPVEVSGRVWSDPSDPRFREVDENIVFTLTFPSGAIAYASASHGLGEGRRYRVYGAAGWTELENAFAYRGQRMKVSRKTGKESSETQEIQLREVNHFAAEMDHFAECVLENKTPWTPGEEGLRDLRVIEKIFEAAHTGKSVKV